MEKNKKMEKLKRIVVCSKCGTLYDMHYINNVEIRKGEKAKFECKHCGMVRVVYKNPKHFIDNC